MKPLLLLLLTSISFGEDSKNDLYNQEILGIFNKQFSREVVSFDIQYKKRSKLVKKLYGQRSIQYKRLVTYYDKVKRNFYHTQTKSTQELIELFKGYNISQLEHLYLGLSTFDKIYYSSDYIRTMWDKKNLKVSTSIPDGSLASEIAQSYQVVKISKRLKFKKNFKAKMRGAINLLIERSQVKTIQSLKESVKSSAFKRVYEPYLENLLKLELSTRKYSKNLP